MNYAANVSGGANSHYPVAGASYGGCGKEVGAILVLFILLVIITRTLLY